MRPQKAIVQPRVTLKGGAAAVRLETLANEWFKSKKKPLIALIGPHGSGKTAALRHLAYAFSNNLKDVALLDEPALEEVRTENEQRTVIYTSDRSFVALRHSEEYELAPWIDDDLIAYLIGRDPARAADAIRRLLGMPERGKLDGNPRVCASFLDLLEIDVALTDFRATLKQHLRESFLTESHLLAAGEGAMWTLNATTAGFLKIASDDYMTRHQHLKNALIYKWDGLRVEQIELATAFLCHTIRTALDPWPLRIKLCREIMRAAAAEVAEHNDLQQALELLLTTELIGSHAMTVSILAAANRSWRPKRDFKLLQYAVLDGVQWTNVDLSGVKGVDASFVNADLSCGTLSRAVLWNANMTHCRMTNALLMNASFIDADLSQADLAEVDAEQARFRSATMIEVNLSGASLINAQFEFTNLTRANLRGANLYGATLNAAVVEDTDLSNVNCETATLTAIKLKHAMLSGASFSCAILKSCDLEGAILPDANFERAELFDSDLTGATMIESNFRSAKIKDCGLAGVNWEKADLREADLRGSTFHMGSSRSGLIVSTTPCEGSRTGFYTDEYTDQCYRRPEEIRKANLRGADLRGANIDRVDFYLVDLRDAIYDADQEAWFRKCSAILSLGERRTAL